MEQEGIFAGVSSGSVVYAALRQAERMEEVSTIQRLQAYPPKVVFRDVWWTRALLNLLPYLMRGNVRELQNESVLRQFAWGVSDVRITE